MSRIERINRVVTEALTAYRNEGHLNIACWEDDYADLMPGLRKELETLIRLQKARELAQCQASLDDPAKRTRDKNLESLRAALPNYEILGEIHYGGQGVVYEAVQRSTKRVVALKVLLEGLRATQRQRYRFEREAELIARLEHRNIVTLFESGAADGRLYYVMQYVDGRPIDDYVLVKDPPLRDIVRLFVKVCHTVAYAHQNGIIHRDLHPANIVIDTNGEPYLLDFGFAKDVCSKPDMRVSAPGQVIGALPYLSPEQVGAGDGRVDVRSDVYSLGIVLYVLLTERFPYRVHGEYGVIREEIVSSEPTSLRHAFADVDPERRAKVGDVNSDLDAILKMSLAKDKQHRYQSMAEFTADLESFLSGGIVKARTANRLYVFRKMLRRYRLAGSIVITTVTILIISTVFTTRALNNARRATELAYDQFDTAFKVVDSVKPLAGGVAVWDNLLTEISGTLPQLSEYAAADPAFEELASKLTERLGDLSAVQGRSDEAASHYRRFLADAIVDWESAPADDAATGRVLRAYRKLAQCSADPKSVYEQGIAFSEKCARDRIGCDTQLELCELQLRYGQYWKSRDANETALPYLNAALALYEAHRGCEPSSTWNRLGAKALNALGLIRVVQGDSEAGYVDLERSRQLRESELSDRPADTTAREELALIYIHLGTLKRDRGDFEEAIQLYQRAIEHRILLHQLDPTVIAWGQQLFSAQVRLGQIYFQLQQFEQAEELFSHAAEVFNGLNDALSTNNDLLVEYTFVLTNRGQLLEREQAYEQALEVFKEADEIRQRLLKEDPGNRRRIKEAAATQQWLGREYSKLGDIDRAVAHYQQACSQYERSYSEDSNSSENILDLVGAQVSQAGACLRTNSGQRWDEAEQVLEQARILLETMQAQGMIHGYEARFELCRKGLENNERILLQKRKETQYRTQ